MSRAPRSGRCTCGYDYSGGRRLPDDRGKPRGVREAWALYRARRVVRGDGRFLGVLVTKIVSSNA